MKWLKSNKRYQYCMDNKGGDLRIEAEPVFHFTIAAGTGCIK
jgi:hypothetical protein